MSERKARARHWRLNVWLVLALLVVWFLVSFVAPYFARELTGVFLGFPIGYWLPAQGALVVYVLIVAVYDGLMARLDDRQAEADPD